MKKKITVDIPKGIVLSVQKTEDELLPTKDEDIKQSFKWESISKPELKSLITKNEMTDSMIAEMFSVKTREVRIKRKKFGLPKRKSR